MSLNNSELKLSDSKSNYAVKFSPTFLKNKTVKKLRSILNNVYELNKKENVSSKEDRINNNYLVPAEEIQPEAIKTETQNSQETKSVMSSNVASSNINSSDIAHNIAQKWLQILTEKGNQNYKSKSTSNRNETITFSSQNKDTKAISHEGLIYNHDNIVTVIFQTMEVVHDTPMRIIGMMSF